MKAFNDDLNKEKGNSALNSSLVTSSGNLLKGTFFLLLMILVSLLSGQEITSFELYVPDSRIDAPVAVSLDDLQFNIGDGSFALYEMQNGKAVKIPSQLETGVNAKLWFILEGINKGNTVRQFLLKIEKQVEEQPSKITLEEQHQKVVLMSNNKKILGYQHETVFPPADINNLYKRSGFIHPVVSPQGEVLSRIQPPDHYHHYGIWGPWTLTRIDDREVDFWNLSKGEGTVQFASFLSHTEGPVYSGFKVLQHHIDFGATGADNIAMNEILDIRTWNTNSRIWIVDYTTTINTPLPDGILMAAYRYGGGIGFRATEKWHKDNCTVLTSEGKTRIDADGSNAKWCIVEGESDTEKGRSGILFLSHPSNRMHPEPMRVWPLDANGGRGDMFFEFTPIRHVDWKLNKNTDYTLKYRMIIFDGKIDSETAEQYWNAFAKLPQIKMKMNQ